MKLTIEGMMCPNCERHCKEALEALGVTVLSISHADKCAEIEKPEAVTTEQLKAAVAGAGYTMVE